MAELYDDSYPVCKKAALCFQSYQWTLLLYDSLSARSVRHGAIALGMGGGLCSGCDMLIRGAFVCHCSYGLPVNRVGLWGRHEIRMSHSAGIASNMHRVRSSLKLHFQVDLDSQCTRSLHIPNFYNNVADSVFAFVNLCKWSSSNF